MEWCQVSTLLASETKVGKGQVWRGVQIEQGGLSRSRWVGSRCGVVSRFDCVGFRDQGGLRAGVEGCPG